MRRTKNPVAGNNGYSDMANAYAQGVAAGRAGPAMNPYAHVSPQHSAWAEGYKQGRAERIKNDRR